MYIQMSELLSMVSLRDRIKQILLEPTLDKALTTFATIMLVTFLLTLFAPALVGKIQYELLIVQGVSCILATIMGLLFKHFDQAARDAASARLKAEINHDYLLKNPKLKETQITLDTLETLCNEMSILRQLVEAALNIKIKANGDKYNDPPTADSATPWSNVIGSAVATKESDKDKPEG